MKKIGNYCFESSTGHVHEKADYKDFIDLNGLATDINKWALITLFSGSKTTVNIHICKHCGCLFAEEVE